MTTLPMDKAGQIRIEEKFRSGGLKAVLDDMSGADHPLSLESHLHFILAEAAKSENINFFLNLFENLRAKRPQDADIMYALCSLYVNRGDFSSAKRLLQNALESNPGDLETEHQLSYLDAIATNAERHPLVQYFKEENPLWYHRVNPGKNVSIDSSVVDRAREAFSRMNAHLHAAKLGENKDDITADLLDALSKLEKEPTAFHEWQRVCAALMLKGDHQGAIMALESVLGITNDPDILDESRMSIALICYTQKDAKKADVYIKQACKEKPENFFQLMKLGASILGDKEFDRQMQNMGLAEAAFRRVIELKKELFTAYNALGTVLLNRGKHNEALEMYDAALKSEPKNERAWSTKYHKAAVFLEMNLRDLAIPLLLEVVDEIPANDPEIPVVINVLLKAGMMKEAKMLSFERLY